MPGNLWETIEKAKWNLYPSSDQNVIKSADARGESVVKLSSKGEQARFVRHCHNSLREYNSNRLRSFLQGINSISLSPIKLSLRKIVVLMFKAEL